MTSDNIINDIESNKLEKHKEEIKNINTFLIFTCIIIITITLIISIELPLLYLIDKFINYLKGMITDEVRQKINEYIIIILLPLLYIGSIITTIGIIYIILFIINKIIFALLGTTLMKLGIQDETIEKILTNYKEISKKLKLD